MQYSYTIWVVCLHLLQFLCSKLKRLKGTVSSQMAIMHVQRDFCNCWLASFTCLPTVQFLITCSSVSAYILQAIKNWMVGRPGDEANCWYLSRKCSMQLVWTCLADYASQCTCTLSSRRQGLRNLHYIQPFNSHWPKSFSWIAVSCVQMMKHKTALKHFTVCATVITWKVSVSVALHISQSLHLCIVCIEWLINSLILWFIASNS